MIDPYQEVLEEVVAAYRWRLQRWQGLRTRIGQIDALVSGSWTTVFPDDSADMDMPYVANIFKTTVEDLGRLFVESAMRTERCYPSGSTDEKHAETREQVLNAYTNESRFDQVLEYFGMDFPAAGFVAIKVWPDMTKPLSERLPQFRRLDPRRVLPEPRWAPDKPTDNVCVHYVETVTELAKTYPEQISGLMENITKTFGASSRTARYGGSNVPEFALPTQLEVVEWYSAAMICRAVVHTGETLVNLEPAPMQEAVMLDHRVNETGLCPVQLAYRPSWSKEPTGQLDDSKGIIRTKNRMFRLLLDYWVDMVYGGKLVWNVRNPDARGPGQTYYAMGPDAKMASVTPENPGFQAYKMLDMLEGEGRSTAVAPASREGEVDLNKASAAFLTRAQGQYTSVTRSHHRNFSFAKQNANEVAFAQDEAWCNARKTIISVGRGKRFKVTYEPKVDIKGDHSSVVGYGTTSGLDLATHTIFQSQKYQEGALSLESFLENDPTVEAPTVELARIFENQMQKAMLAGLSDPAVDIATRAKALIAFRGAEDKGNLDDVLALLAATPAPGAGPPPPAMPTVAGMEPPPAGGPAPPGIAGVEGSQQPGPVLPPKHLLQVAGPRR